MESLLRMQLENVEGEKYMALVNGKDGVIEVIVVSCKTETINPDLSFTINDSKEFVENITLIFKNHFKAVILNLFHFDQLENFPTNLELCEAVREQFRAIKLPHFFLSDHIISLSIALMSTEIDNIKNGEIVVIVQQKCCKYSIFELTFSTSNGYRISDRREIVAAGKKDLDKVEDARAQIVGSGKPKRIILHSANNSMLKYLKKSVLKNDKNVFEFFPNEQLQIPKFLAAMTKWLGNKKFNKYFIAPYCMGYYSGEVFCNDKYYPLMEADFKDPLPLMCIEVTSKIHTKIFLNWGSKCRKEVPFDLNCHRLRINLMVDQESFPTCTVEPIYLRCIQSLPRKLDRTILKDKIPVIAFFDHSSVICVAKNAKKRYQFCKAWNGQFGNEVVISFDKEKPTYCKEALEAFAANPTYFVYDLINIMSMPPDVDSIEPETFWKFKVSKGENDPVLLEFDTLTDGEKAATPAFLLALILKQHLKAIRTETGTKHKRLGFYVAANHSEIEMQRIEGQLEESCKLLKIECVFVKFLKMDRFAVISVKCSSNN